MKNSKKRSPIWPYLGILAFLFLLSLTAPRAWERGARREIGRVTTGAAGIRWEPHVDPRSEAEDGDARDLDWHRHDPVENGALEPMDNEVENLPLVIPPAPEFAEEFCEELDSLIPGALVDAEPKTELAAAPAVPEAPREPVPEVPAAVAYVWPLPRVLLDQLSRLDEKDPQLAWPRKASELVRVLCQDPTDREATRKTLEQLGEVADREAVLPTADIPLQAEIVRTRYALARWVDIWRAAAALDNVPLDKRVGQTSPETIQARLAEFDALADSSAAGDAWRLYLKLPALRAAAGGSSDEARRTAARAVLDRLASSRLSPAQRRFAEKGPLAKLQQALRGWAAEGVTVADFLTHLEQFEFSGLNSDGRLVANDYRALNWSAPAESGELSQQLDTHYRNANLRVAASKEFIDRMVPQPQRMDEPVRDTVINVPVRGRASTFTKLTVVLVPDARRIRLGLEARGVVDSNTVSSSGPATFRNTGQSTFLVKKLFVLGPQGLVVWPAIAEAENNYNYLTSLETNYDGVPLVGPLVYNIARSKYDEARGNASRETAKKVAIRALRQLDGEVDTQLEVAGKNLEEKQLATLRRLGLELTPIAMSTSKDRVVARARLSGREQVGAFTPRPQAPSDSWLSWQMHESAVNNGLTQLDLEGRTFELPELFRWLADKLGRPELAEQEDLPEGVQVTFADKDAVSVQCENGLAELTLRIAELKHEGSRWRDFQVRTTYTPEAEGLTPKFVRKDTIHLDGRSLKGKVQFKLRAIFSRVLSKNREVTLLGESITGNPRWQDLQITQFTIVDGWIALAYSQRQGSNRVVRQAE